MIPLRLTMLGTGSGRPTLARNVSSVAVERDGRLVLLDCGEAAQLQILRAGLRTSRIDAILLTHLHGDHVNGLPGLVGTLGLEGRDRSLQVVGPRGLADYYAALCRAGALAVPFPVEIHELSAPREHFRIGPFSVEALPLDHRISTYGFALTEPNRPGSLDVARAIAAGIASGPLLGRLKAGEVITLPDGRTLRPDEFVGAPQRGRRIAYVSDTRPCDNGVQLGAGATLLVHEATYPHSRAEDAAARGHSTALQAAQIAVRAAPNRLVLTHLSPSVDPAEMLAEARGAFLETLLAEDLRVFDA